MTSPTKAEFEALATEYENQAKTPRQIWDETAGEWRDNADVQRRNELIATALRIAAASVEAVPVAYQYRWKIDGEWVNWRVADASQAHSALASLEERPLYAAPPAAPDRFREGEIAGLERAAKLIDDWTGNSFGVKQELAAAIRDQAKEGG